jgi:hypothetical protein
MLSDWLTTALIAQLLIVGPHAAQCTVEQFIRKNQTIHGNQTVLRPILALSLETPYRATVFWDYLAIPGRTRCAQRTNPHLLRSWYGKESGQNRSIAGAIWSAQTLKSQSEVTDGFAAIYI